MMRRGAGCLYVRGDGEVSFPSSIKVLEGPGPRGDGPGQVLPEDVLSLVEGLAAEEARPN